MAAHHPTHSSFKNFNGPSGAVTDQAAREFINAIKQARDQGIGFVPLIGSGFSAPSGIPILRELSLYLQRCIALALGVDVGEGEGRDGKHRRWNPRKDQWPPLSDPRRPQDIEWHLRVYEEWQLRKRSPITDPELPVFQEAIGALAEWRSSLLFLSRLDVPPDEPTDGRSEKLFLNVPRQDVVDACFLHVIEGRRPTLGHRMLAHLSALLLPARPMTLS